MYAPRTNENQRRRERDIKNQTYVQTVHRLEPDISQRHFPPRTDLVPRELQLLRHLRAVDVVKVECGLVDDELDTAGSLRDVLC